MTEPDGLLEQLGAIEREYDQAFPHEWEAVVRGERAADEVIAARRDQDDPDELEALARTLTPLRDAERDAWMERLAAHLHAPAEPDAVVDLDDRRRDRGGHARSRSWVSAGLAVLAAAALTLWLLPGDDRLDPPGSSSARSMPSFALVVRNETVHEIRSDPPPADGIHRYQPRSQLHWVLRPERSLPGPLGLRVLVEPVPGTSAPSSRRLVVLDRVQASPRGVLELRGTVDELLDLGPGRYALRFVIGDPTVLPADLPALDRGGTWTMTEPYAVEVVP